MKNPTFILSADWHIRSDSPEGRIDDFIEAQERKINFILDLSNKYQCPIIIAGDIGDKPRWENWLLERYIKKFNKHAQKIYVLPGQHDLLNHRLDKLAESGLGVLVASKVVKLLLWDRTLSMGQIIINIYSFPFGDKIESISSGKGSIRNVAIVHQLVSQSKLWQGQENFTSAKSLLKKFPCYDLIMSGDNHQSFVERYEGRLLVNPGSIMRITTSQFNHASKVYLWSAESNEVEEIEIPVKPSKDVFNLSMAKRQIKRNERMLAFVESLKSDCEFKMGFEDNLNNFLNKNKIEQGVKDKIFTALEKGEE